MGLVLSGCEDDSGNTNGGDDNGGDINGGNNGGNTNGATVTSVTVSPSSASVAKGENKTFTATVAGTNNPAKTVTWSIVETNKDSGTKITSSGVLTVAAAESLSSLTIKAASTVDTSKSGTAKVTVTGGNTTEYRIDQAIFENNSKSGNDLVFNWTLKTTGKTPNGLYTYTSPSSIEVSVQQDSSYFKLDTLDGSARTYTLKNFATWAKDDKVYFQVKCVSTYNTRISYVVYSISTGGFTPNYPSN